MSARMGGAIRFRSTRGLWLPLILIAGLLLAATPAEAQVTPFGVTLSVAGSRELTATDLACVTDVVTVTNTGQSPVPPQHNIAITTSGPATGWTVEQAPPESFQLAPGANEQFTVRICPGPDVQDGARTTYAIRATVTDDRISNQPASDELALTIRATDDRLFGLDIPNSALWIALAGMAALIALVLLTRNRQAGGVSVSCPEASKTVAPGRGTSFPIRIRNEGRSKDVVSLATTPVPPGWDTFLPLVDIPLEPREEQTVWLSVKSPEDAESGDHLVVKVTVRSSSAIGEQATIDTLTTVRAGTPPKTPAAPREEPESSVYGSEDDDVELEEEAEPRPVAVKRRKA